MGFDDIYAVRVCGCLRHESDLEERSRRDGNLRKGLGGTRHGAYVQAITARRESIAGRRRLDHLGQGEASRLVTGLYSLEMAH
jgi:hypothetical protein